MAAVLACGEHACAAGAAAAHLWGFGPPPADGWIDVIVVGRHVGSRPGIRVHCVERLDPRDRARRHNIPVTSAARAILDRASQVALPDLERLLDEAVIQRVTTHAAVKDVLARYPANRGVARLRRLVADEPPMTKKEAERRFRGLVRSARVPQPLGKLKILGYEVDFIWPDQRLIVEIDGYAFHSSRRRFETDRERDAKLHAAGFIVVRFTWRQLRYEPAAILFRLGQLLRPQ
jgi:very-short-patch-repair endonuclease